MSFVATGYDHIVIGEDGVPVIAGTTMKVVELVAEHMPYGWSPEELYFQHPYLTLGQIYSALASYWDHAQELNKAIEHDLHKMEPTRQAAEPSPLVARLKAKRLL